MSFGLTLEARAVLNSVFLHHCVQAGLDMAIVNPAHVRPYAEIADDERALADDLVFTRRPDALARFIAHYDGAGAASARRRRGRRSDRRPEPRRAGALDGPAPAEGGDRGGARRRGACARTRCAC